MMSGFASERGDRTPGLAAGNASEMSSFLSSNILCPNNGDVIWTSIKLPNGEESRYLTDFTEFRLIGIGGFGVVAECQNKLDKKIYAVKKISLKATNMSFQKILREVEVISSMNHPNVVRYYQSWVEPFVSGCIDDLWEREEIQSPCLYIVMEYCPGCLSSFLDVFNDHYSREQALMIFRQIAEALAHIHEKNIIHRDLHRSNIFLDENQNVKVGDFGLAKRLDHDGLASVSTSFGTNRAPEYAYGEVDSKADIYSLGVILAELLKPFSTASERIKVLGDLRNGVFPDTWEDQHVAVISRLISENPLARPSAAEILEDEYFVG